ncbi:tetratricopeptide repeat-containing sensor histidine kinase [Mucilaginibacter sp.]
MFPNNYLRRRFNLAYLSLVFGLVVTLVSILFFSSCKKQQPADNGEMSAEFAPINDSVAKLNATKRPKQGIKYLDSAYHQLSNHNLDDIAHYYGYHFMYSKRELRNTKLELAYADSIMLNAEKSNNLKSYVSDIANANFAKGDAYFDLNQYTTAYRYYYQGYILGKNYLDNGLLAEYTYRMGMVSFRQSHFDLAAKNFKESFKLSAAYTDDFRGFYQKQELLNDVGESYLNLGNTDSAGVYFNKTLAFIDKYSERFKDISYKLDIARAVTWGDQGKLMYEIGNYAEAEGLLKKSIDFNLKRSYDNYDAELVETDLANLYLKEHQLKPLFSLLQNLHNQLDSAKNVQALSSWNRLMSAYFTENKDYANALAYYESYSHLKDSLSQVDVSIKEADITQQLANYDKQYQIQDLKNNNKLQSIFLALAVIGVIMALVIIVLVFRNWQRSKRDIREISELNQQINSQKSDLETTLEELKINGQEKDRILRTVAHDLRNPIGGIVSLTNVMLQDEYTEDQKELITLVNSTSQNTLELINEILDATNNKIGKSNKELVDINELVNNSVEILSFKASEKDQKIITQLSGKPEMLLVSRERIWRVISNLISNAIKFSSIGAAIYVDVMADGQEVKISVKDTGIGIPDNIKNEVFNIFTDAKRPGTAGEKSFGLGLSICQQIIENHDGKIWFDSEAGKGTTFYVTLKRPQI